MSWTNTPERAQRQQERNERRSWSTFILTRDPICQWEGCTNPSTEADHIIPLARGGTWSYSNGQGLCSTHHRYKTAAIDSKPRDSRKRTPERHPGMVR